MALGVNIFHVFYIFILQICITIFMSLNLNNMETKLSSFDSTQKPILFHALSIFRQNELIWHFLPSFFACVFNGTSSAKKI